MTNYVDSTFYLVTYLDGKEAVIDTASFDFYARKATRIIKQYTLNNIDENQELPEELKMCCCEVAETIYKKENPYNLTDASVKSESTGSHSITFESQSVTEDYYKAVIKGIIYNWLSDTGYLYRGLS